MVYNRAAVIIIDKGKVLLLHRIKDGREYYVIPGGTIEDNETPEQAAVREIKEETNLDIKLGKKVLEVSDEWHNGSYFLSAGMKGSLKFI